MICDVGRNVILTAVCHAVKPATCRSQHASLYCR